MKTFQIAFIILGTLVAAGVFFVSSRNHLIDLDEGVREQWSQIDTQLQRRSDLIPNLVNTVKGYAAHESKIFTDVAEARSRLLAAKSPADKADASAGLSSVLGRLLAIKENYPALKADQNFIRLQDELAGTENRIAVARTRYNNTVKEYNAAIRRIPGVWLAGSLDLKKADYYEPKDIQSMQTPPAVKF